MMPLSRRGRRGRLILVLGGTRSGKSLVGLRVGQEVVGPRLFIATGRAGDTEMRVRIKRHKAGRGRRWTTRQAPRALRQVVTSLNGRYRVAVIDSLTQWIANLMAARLKDTAIHQEARRLIQAVRKHQATVIIVTDEVGWGIVPVSPLGRRFRDLAGLINQQVARAADEVYAVLAGLPVRVK